MKQIKTVRGYLSALKRLECIPLCTLKGYDDISEEQREFLGILSADVSNALGEFEYINEK